MPNEICSSNVKAVKTSQMKVFLFIPLHVTPLEFIDETADIIGKQTGQTGFNILKDIKET